MWDVGIGRVRVKDGKALLESRWGSGRRRVYEGVDEVGCEADRWRWIQKWMRSVGDCGCSSGWHGSRSMVDIEVDVEG